MGWLDTFAVLVFVEGCAEVIKVHSMGTHPFYPLLIVQLFTVTGLWIRWRAWCRRAAEKRETLVQALQPHGGSNSRAEEKKIVGFFHPYCNAGGGGEVVLWTAVAHMQRTEPGLICVVYTGDIDATKDDIITKVKSRFDIDLEPSSLAFVWLNNRSKVDAKTWPRFTLIGQSAGSMILALEALDALVPDIFIDSMGYAFTFPLVALLSKVFRRIPIGAYVHYPTISTDMLERVQSRTAGHTNPGDVASSAWRSTAKLLYYRIFAFLYSISLLQADKIVVNSSWTKAHIDYLQNEARKHLRSQAKGKPGVDIVYPPCNMDRLKDLPLEGRERIVLSVAQFRPEKEHSKQIHIMDEFLKAHPSCRSGPDAVRLVLVGGCRTAEDEERVQGLKDLVHELNLEDNVTFAVNAPFAELLGWFGRSSVGISTMIDEHFGINIVEYMASGLIPLVHGSGGPLNDIVLSPDHAELMGFHETDVASYVDALADIFVEASEEDRLTIRKAARASALKRFGPKNFEDGWASFWRDLTATRSSGHGKRE